MNIQTNTMYRQIGTTSAERETAIIKTLLKLGIPANTKGFHYIKTALMIGIESPIALTSMSKTIYPAISERYFSASSSSIERAIRYAIGQSAQRGDASFICQIFGYTSSLQFYNPTNREFLAVVAEYIRENHCTAAPQGISA